MDSLQPILKEQHLKMTGLKFRNHMITWSIKSLLVCWIFAFATIHVKAQSAEFENQRVEMAFFNIGVNALIGGLGSVINTKEEKPTFKTFARGFYKGAIGGGLSHIGLSMTHQISRRQNIAIAWPSRMVNALGSSIIQNAAEDKRMFERLHFNLYLVRLEYYPYKKKFNARLFTSSIYGIAVVGKGARFDIGKTLQTGIIYFESSARFSSSLGSGRATGQVSSIGMGEDLTGDRYYDIYAEEVAHIIQYDRLVGGNALMYKPDMKFKSSSKLYKNLSKFIYFDLNGPLLYIAYSFENSSPCNFIEQEAVNYANKRVDCIN